jgi:hypothetical protein
MPPAAPAAIFVAVVAVETVPVNVPDTVRFVTDRRAAPGLYVNAVAVWIALFAKVPLLSGVNVIYRVELALVDIVSTVSDPVAWPFNVVHVTVAHVIRPVPVIPLPINKLGVPGTT